MFGKIEFLIQDDPRYLVSFFTGRMVVPIIIISFFSVLRNTTASILVSDIVILYLSHQLWITPTAVFAFISSSLRLFPLMRMHKSLAYAAKSVIPFFFQYILVYLFGSLCLRSKIGADCRHEVVFGGSFRERRASAKTCGRKHSQRTNPVHKLSL